MTGCVVGLVLLVMTPFFEKLPLNVMGAIVVSACKEERALLMWTQPTACC